MRVTGSHVVTTAATPFSTGTVLVLVSTFVALIWSIFTPPHKTYAARVLLFQPAWMLLYGYSSGAWTLPDFGQIDLSSHELHLYIQIFSLLGGCGAFAGGIVHREHQLNSSEASQGPRSERIDEQLLPPLLIPSRTTHTRIFPEKHDFSYSYLFVGIPVGSSGRISSALSVDSQERSWFHVSSADYLDRGYLDLSLGEKLKKYLHTQGVTDRDYAFAYLVTAPRLFGYSFNPVSFWYLYDSETRLKYIILEVNNTFDERRMYLLEAHNTKHDSGVDFSSQPDESAKTTIFSQTFEKDFHVSPFNSRKGSYSLKATDPLVSYEETGNIKIDNTIVLSSSKQSPKIVARVFSVGKPRHAVQISQIDLARFIASWCWVGFATFPRIVWQAQRLFFKRKLHVWYRPEVAARSVGRDYTHDERHLELIFREWLEHAVNDAGSPLKVVYEPAHNEGQEVVMFSRAFTFQDDSQQMLKLQVLTPAFYTRFVHYAHATEAFDRECLATDEKNRTLVIENASVLPALMDAIRGTSPANSSPKISVLDQARWSCLRRLRCSPPDTSCPHSEDAKTDYNVTEIRSSSDPELDTFVRSHHDDSRTFRRIVTKLFLAQRYALGVPALISALDWTFRGLLVLATMYFANHRDTIDVFRPKQYDTRDVWTFAGLIVSANAVHAWSLLKG